MKVERMLEIGRGAIECHLGDVMDEGADTLYDEAFVLAHDALVDSGVDNRTASKIASQLAQEIAQP